MIAWFGPYNLIFTRIQLSFLSKNVEQGIPLIILIRWIIIISFHRFSRGDGGGGSGST
jgi:hypothetical protein